MKEALKKLIAGVGVCLLIILARPIAKMIDWLTRNLK